MTTKTMRSRFKGWDEVALLLAAESSRPRPAHGPGAVVGPWLDEGQCASLACMARTLPVNGVLLADEVGMGKTRIAVAVARAVVETGGRVAILVPPAVGDQWRSELRGGDVGQWSRATSRDGDPAPPFLRSLDAYVDQYDDGCPWFRQPVVLLSQTFANWKLSSTSQLWRWALLPLLYGQWRKLAHDRFPKRYHNLGDDDTSFYREDRTGRGDKLWQCAESIVKAIPQRPHHPAHQRMCHIAEAASWPQIAEPASYDSSSQFRPLLEQAVGLGLGAFDLIIVDEAHKARGQSSGLSRILDNVLLAAKDGRRLAMTATPVELDAADWKTTLARIGVDAPTLAEIDKTATQYVEATRAVRMRWRFDAQARDTYRTASADFRQALKPYVLRRDKREDPVIRAFMERTAEPVDAYRRETPIDISWSGLSLSWRQAVCAAEALSQASRGSFEGKSTPDQKLQRLRLTIGNGHGIATMLQVFNQDGSGPQDTVDKLAEDTDPDVSPPPEAQVKSALQESGSKRAQRVAWWKTLLTGASSPDDGSRHGERHPLYNHPSILKVVETIEEDYKDEKVLVFARYTKPMHSLADLLNARAMVRHLQTLDDRAQVGLHGLPWPQSSVLDNERPAVLAALRQLGISWTLQDVNEKLATQAREWERRRERSASLERIRAELVREGGEARRNAIACLDEFARCTQDHTASRAQLGLALEALLDDPARADAAEYARAFCDLAELISGAEDHSQAGMAGRSGQKLIEYLHGEYSTRRDTYAQLMHGGTKPDARRVRQAAFNRKNVFPRVLIAQSRVAREGLNLHLACRVVIMLHPEWNPAVAEQQVGRVDRKNSYWTELFNEWKRDPQGKDVPRIEIRPVMFEGTYDEHHWNVLRTRWDDLRAQLHSVVVPQRDRLACSEEERYLIAELDGFSPNFSPSRAGSVPISSPGTAGAEGATPQQSQSPTPLQEASLLVEPSPADES